MTDGKIDKRNQMKSDPVIKYSVKTLFSPTILITAIENRMDEITIKNQTSRKYQVHQPIEPNDWKNLTAPSLYKCLKALKINGWKKSYKVTVVSKRMFQTFHRE